MERLPLGRHVDSLIEVIRIYLEVVLEEPLFDEVLNVVMHLSTLSGVVEEVSQISIVIGFAIDFFDIRDGRLSNVKFFELNDFMILQLGRDSERGVGRLAISVLGGFALSVLFVVKL